MPRKHHWNITEQLLNDTIKRRRLLLGVENQVVREMATILRDCETELAGRVVAFLGENDPDTWLTAARQARLLNGLQATINETFPRLQRTVEAVAREQAIAEADVLLGRLRAALKQAPMDLPVYSPSAKQLKKLVTHGLPKDMGGQMQALDDEISGLAPKARRNVHRAFKEAVIRGDGVGRIASSVKKAMGVSAREATVAARTMIQRVANDSARTCYHRNRHLIGSVRRNAVFDKKTCVQCGSQDAKTFPVTNQPVLPAHYQCRCFLTAVVKSWQGLGIPAEKATPEIRRLFDGKPAQRPNYQTWLREQPAATQKDILGASRYSAFSKDKAVLDDFATDRRVLTVSEWKEKAA